MTVFPREGSAMSAVMTGITHLSLLSRGLILCDLVAVTAHGESLGDVFLPRARAPLGEAMPQALDDNADNSLASPLTALHPLLFDQLQVLLKFSLMIQFLLINFY